MNFFYKYKDLFEVNANTPVIQNRLTFDNDLFIQKPYVPTYKQEYTLNSKLRDLKKDYNTFEEQVNEIEHYEKLEKRSDSQRKQYHKQRHENSPKLLQHHQLSRNNPKKRNQSNIFAHYTDDYDRFNINKKLTDPKHDSFKINNQNNKYNQNQGQIVPVSFQRGKKPKVQEKQKFKNKRHNVNEINNRNQDYEQQQKQNQHRQLQELQRQNFESSRNLIQRQNFLKNKYYMESNNVLQQSQIDHLFGQKLPKSLNAQKIDNLPETTIPKYKIQNSSIESGGKYGEGREKGKSFLIRTKSNNNEFSNRQKIVPHKREYNQPNTQSKAMQRRKQAKLQIDQRRQKLRRILKAVW